MNWIRESKLMLFINALLLCGIIYQNYRPSKPVPADDSQISQWSECLDECDRQQEYREKLCDDGSNKNWLDCIDESDDLQIRCYDKCDYLDTEGINMTDLKYGSDEIRSL